LLLYVGPGGACWKSPQDVVHIGCRIALPPDPFSDGIWTQDECNPFRSYTKVYIHYCTGDVHSGTTTDTWIVPNHTQWGLPQAQQTVHMNGFNNAMSALQWARTNFGSQTLKSLAVMGSSAGSLGAMIWAGYALRMFPHEQAAVVFDSCTGYFPVGTVPYLFKSLWGSCYTQAFINGANSVQATECEGGNADIASLPSHLVAAFPQVPFSVLESKEDHIQIRFWNDLVRTFQLEGVQQLDGPGLYAGMNDIFAKNKAASKSNNYVVYYAAGNYHVFTNYDKFCTTTTEGEDGPNGLRLVDWMTPLAVGNKPSPLFVCKGTLIDTKQPNDLVNTKVSVEYCDSNLDYGQSSLPSASMPADTTEALRLAAERAA